MSELKLIGGSGDGRSMNAPVALKHGKTFRYFKQPEVWAASSAVEANEIVEAESETYRVVRYSFGDEGAQRFIAAPVEWSDVQVFDRLIARYKDGQWFGR